MKPVHPTALAALFLLLLLLGACTGALGPSAPLPSESIPAATDPAGTEPPAETEPPAAPDPVEALLREMTVEEKVGQLFLVRCPESGAAETAQRLCPGGYVLFGRDFRDGTPESVRAAIASWQEACRVPMLIAVDEEGGTVNRVSRYPAFREAPFRSPREVLASGGLEAVRSDTAEKAELLRSLGINVNLAPVCDLSDDPEDFIYDRSPGGDGARAGEYAAAVVETAAAHGLGSVLKHFPGYGGNADTHTGIAYDQRSFETFEQRDFVPFRMAIAAGADAVLVSHNVVECMDPDFPASLSPEVHRVLREDLGFTGVVITDDLAMEAITQFTDGESAAVLAVEAGNDLLCCSDVETQLPAVLAAVRSGRISGERLDQSVRRILQWKADLGLLEGAA